MRRFCLTRPALLLPVVAIVSAVLGCGGSGGPGRPEAFPTPLPEEIRLGTQIAFTYSEMLNAVQALVEPRPPAPEVKETLRVIRGDYRARFGNYGCLRATMTASQQEEVGRTAEDTFEATGPAGLDWLEDAASDYDFEDTAIAPLLRDIAHLDDYAYLDRLETSRPGEVALCGG